MTDVKYVKKFFDMETIKIIYNGIHLTVEGEYEPEERTVWYYADGSGHPGSPPMFEISEIYDEDGDIVTDSFIDEFDEIERLALDKKENELF